MTLRLAGLASANWRVFDGWATSSGIDLDALALGRFCNLVYYWCTRNAPDEAAVAKFDSQLWVPPRGVVPTEGPWSAQAETAAFASLKKALG